MKKILIADDHPVIRYGLKIFIEKVANSFMIDEAWNSDLAFEKIKHNEYALIILDATIAGEDSFSLVSNTLALQPDAKILMFSVSDEEMYAKKYLQHGAKGYLSKDASEPEIVNAIRNVLNNKRYISASLMDVYTQDALGNKAYNPFHNLTTRELEITMHLLRGETVSEISHKLNIHTSTVGTHKAKIFEKLHCKNIIDINVLAKMYKVISPN